MIPPAGRACIFFAARRQAFSARHEATGCPYAGRVYFFLETHKPQLFLHGGTRLLQKNSGDRTHRIPRGGNFRVAPPPPAGRTRPQTRHPQPKRPYPPSPSESPDCPHACRPSCPHVACPLPTRPPTPHTPCPSDHRLSARPSTRRTAPVRSPSKPLRTAPAYPSGASAHSLDVPRTPDRPSPPFAKYANVFGAQHANNQQTQAQYPLKNGKIYPLRGRKSATATLFFNPPISPLNRSENNDNRRTLLIEIVAEHLSYKKNTPPFFAKK